jgi:putative salt-induced outer membrane protein YdiY
MRITPACLLVVPCLAVPALADEVVLVTGEKLTGTITSSEGETVVLEHPVLGRLVIPKSKLAAPTPPVSPVAPVAPVAPATPAPAPAAPPAPPEDPNPWKFKVEAGVTGSAGNVEQSDLHAAISTVLDNDARKVQAKAAMTRSEIEGEKTKDQSFVEATHDWKFKDSPWTVFVTGRGDFDRFQDWDERASLGVGAGYLVFSEKTFTARARAGLAATREWGASGPDRGDWRPEALAGAEANWQPNATNTVEVKTTVYPDLNAGGEYRWISSAAWSIKLSTTSSLSLKLGIENEFDSHREAPFDENDFKYFAALLWEF